MAERATEHIIRAEDVKRRYRRGGEDLWALRGITLDIVRGEFLSIMGPSGSGKSTFFNQLGALEAPTEGRVFFEGQSLFELPESQQAWIRCNKLGYIFQTFNLIPVMSALQNVMLPVLFTGAPREEAERKASKILDRVGLGHRLGNRPAELSGGQQQRVAVARALVNTPDVILADEPTGNLDTKTGEAIIELLKSLNASDGVTVICATHDAKMARASHRICRIKDGMVERMMTPVDIPADMH